MRGAVQTFWAAAAAFCLWRRQRSIANHDLWRARQEACERRASGTAEARR